jgi:4-hydroxy-tetrahydrodipicolinate synthase
MNGVIAAVATPLGADGRLHLATFERLLDALIESGVDGVCLGGATSEYPNVLIEDRKAAIRLAGARVPRDRALLVAVGAPSPRQIIELGDAAEQAGCRAVLLPMPMFFRYEQHDLAAFSIELSRQLRPPVLLYDLPDFTNALNPSTVVALLEQASSIVGIKDSSGDVDHLDTYAGARDGRDWTLLVGHDRLFYQGLRAGWNGGVSGIAGFCPELLLEIYRNHTRGAAQRAGDLQALLNEMIVQLDTLPTPWGVRLALEARDFDMGPLPLPLSDARREDVTRFRQYLPAWMERVKRAIGGYEGSGVHNEATKGTKTNEEQIRAERAESAEQ